MITFDVQFYPSDSDPTGEALEQFGVHDEVLREIIETEILELANAYTLTQTFVTHVKDNLWYLQGYHKGRWAVIFFVKVAKDTIILLNGYSKRLRSRPAISAGQLRKARYLVKELQYA